MEHLAQCALARAVPSLLAGLLLLFIFLKQDLMHSGHVAEDYPIPHPYPKTLSLQSRSTIPNFSQFLQMKNAKQLMILLLSRYSFINKLVFFCYEEKRQVFLNIPWMLNNLETFFLPNYHLIILNGKALNVMQRGMFKSLQIDFPA